MAEAPSSAAVLTINGEQVTLPKAENAPASVRPEPALTLESLTEAFNRFPTAGGADSGSPAREDPASPASGTMAPADGTVGAAPDATTPTNPDGTTTPPGQTPPTLPPEPNGSTSPTTSTPPTM